MKSMKTLLMGALPLLLLAPFAQAQNDECAGAIAIGAGVTAYDTTGATTSAPAWPCALGGTDLWYSYTSGGLPEDVVVDTCNGNTGYDSALEVFDACGGTSIQCNDDTCGLQSQVAWTAAANTTYLLRVGGFNSASGAGELTLTATPIAPTTLGQDDCADAALDSIAGDGSWLIDNSGATTGTEGQNEANCYKFGTSAVQSDVWVEWSPTVSGTVTMDTCATGGTNTDTKMAAYPGGACPTDGSSLDCNDDTCSLRSEITFTVCCGDSYLVQLGSFPGSADGTFTLTATQSGIPCGGSQRWSQSVDNTTIVPGSVSCNAGGLHTDNSYMRRYESTDVGLGAGEAFTATAVDFGIEVATGATGSQPLTVNVYSIINGVPLTFGALSLVESVPLVIADGSAFFVNAPLAGAAIPAGSDLVVEIFTPEGQTAGNSLFIGSNPLGQTAPSYLAAAACGVAEPIDTAAIGFPNMHLILDITVGADDGIIGCNYCGPAVAHSGGLSGVITATGDDTAGGSFTLTGSDLPAGENGVFVASPGNGVFMPPASQGFFCLGGGGDLIGRFLPTVTIDGAGMASITVDSNAIPTAMQSGGVPITIAMLPGDTWNFQLYFRDGANTNFTDATSVMFL